jgi:hypothetical protein
MITTPASGSVAALGLLPPHNFSPGWVIGLGLLQNFSSGSGYRIGFFLTALRYDLDKSRECLIFYKNLYALAKRFFYVSLREIGSVI